MSYTVIFTKKADLDIHTTIYWYNEQKTGLGTQFRDRVFEKVTSIAHNPKIYKVRYGTIRSVSLSKFPYLVYYTISENKIVVLAILHAKRNPKLWIERKLYE